MCPGDCPVGTIVSDPLLVPNAEREVVRYLLGGSAMGEWRQEETFLVHLPYPIGDEQIFDIAV